MARRRRARLRGKAPVGRPEPGRWELPPRVAHLLAIGAFVLAAAILFREPLAGGSLYGSDLELEFRGNRAYGFSEIAKGRIPYWNPYQFCGYPFVASLQSAIFYPPNVVFLLLDVGTAFTASIFFHVALAGLLAYALAAAKTKSASASLVAAIVAGLSSTLISRVWAGHITLINGYPWLFLTLAALELTTRRSWRRWGVVGGLALALEITAGHPAVPALGVLLTTVYSAAALLTPSIGERRQAVALTGGVSLVLGPALAAVQVLPTAEYLFTSARRSGVSFDFAAGGSFPPEGLLLLFAPGFFGSTPDGTYWGRWHEWELMPFIGIAGLLVVLGGRPRSSQYPLLASMIAGFALAFGQHGLLYPLLFEWVPGFSLLRGPGRMFLMIVPLAAIYIAVLLSDRNDERRWALLRRLAAGGICVAVVAVMLWSVMTFDEQSWHATSWRRFTSLILSAEDRYESEAAPLPDEAFYKSSFEVAGRSLVVATVVGALLATAIWGLRRSRAAWVASCCVAVVGGTELWLASRPYVSSEQLSPESFPVELVEALHRSGLGDGRIASLPALNDHDRGAVLGVPHAGGYDPALPARYVTYMNAHMRRPPGSELVVSEPFIPDTLLRLMGVSHVLLGAGMRPLQESVKVASVAGRDIYRLKNGFPRTFTVHQARVVEEAEALLDLLRSGEVDPLAEALLEAPLDVDLNGGTGSSRIASYEAHSVVIEAELSDPGLVVLTDTHDPGWTASVDGEPAEVVPVHHLFRGVMVGAGPHRIELVYSTRTVRLGAGLSLGALAMCAFMALGRRRAPRSGGTA